MFFFFNDTATTEIYTLSLHDALPICRSLQRVRAWAMRSGSEARVDGLALEREHTEDALVHAVQRCAGDEALERLEARSEEHMSELQSRQYLVCRLLLEKKK